MDDSVGRRRITISRRTLSYLACGPFPHDALVVFLHAFPLNAAMWAPQLRAVPDGWAAVAADMRVKLVGPTTHATRPAVVGAVDAMMRDATPAGIGFAVARIMNRPDSSAVLSSFREPVCVVVGEDDALTPPAEAAVMAALVPGAALATIPGAGHLSNLEAPGAFNAAMLDWLDRVASARP